MAELGPDLMRRRAVPVELHVVVLAVYRSVFLTLVVVRQATRADSRRVRQREEVQDPQRDRIDQAPGNLVPREGGAAGAISIAGERVVDGLHRAVRVNGTA